MKTYYRVHEFAKEIGVSPATVRRWDVSGKLIASRTLSGHRQYTNDDVQKALGLQKPQDNRKVVVYCRVSSRGQLDDLESQVKSMETFCLSNGYAVDEWIKEVGGGMNFKRKKFLKLLDQIDANEVRLVVIAHKDRFARFGFEYFFHFAKFHKCQIVVANQESLSPQQEMVEDLMTIVHTFSCRLYGLRSYKQKKIKQCLKGVIDESGSQDKT